MKLYRIASRLYPAFDGTGAMRYGGRWNNPGRTIVYTSSNLSCARLEILAHMDGKIKPRHHVSIEVSVPEGILAEEIRLSELPAGWNAVPDLGLARQIGDRWYDEGRSLLLKVPSVPAAGDFNYLINQEHRDFSILTASMPVPVDWDGRLLKTPIPEGD